MSLDPGVQGFLLDEKKTARVLLAVSVIALILSSASLYLSIGLQSAIASMHSDLKQIGDGLDLLADAAGVPRNQEELQKLIAAKKEGTLVVYGSMEDEIMSKFKQAFQAKFGVEVQYWRASSTGVLDRVLTELKAGNPQFDVVLTNRAPMFVMKAAGAFSKYASPSSIEFPENAKDPDGILQPIYRVVVISILFNTKVVTPIDAPKDLMELLDPKWKDKLVMPDPAQHTTTTQWLFNLRNVLGANWEPFIRGLCKQNVRLVRSFLPSVETVIKGEKGLGITYVKYVKVFEQAPLDYVRLPVLLADVHSIGLGAKAKHPNAAKLFIDFLLSRQGLSIIANEGEFVATPGIFPPIKDADKLKIAYMDELTDEQFKQWGTTFNQWLTSC